MVIEDFWGKKKTKKLRKKSVVTQRPHYPLALPFDRLAAIIADLVLFVPLTSVFLAFFRKKMVLAQLIGTEIELQTQAIFYFVAVVFLGFLYQVFFISFFGATPGKYFFGLRVWNVWTKAKPKPLEALLRTSLWWLDVFLLIPLLAIFFDSHRRPLHDRLADTIVINQRNRHADNPSPWESGLARGILLSTVLTICFAFFTHYWSVPTGSNIQSAIKRWAGGTPFCEEVDRAVERWPAHSGQVDQRLSVAMALFASGEINEECLDHEADALIWLKDLPSDKMSFAYLAKAFSKMDTGDKSNEYLDMVCKTAPHSESCSVISLIESLQEEADATQREERKEEIFKVLSKSTHEYVKIWTIRYFYKLGLLEEIQPLISDLSLNSSLSKFLTEFRIKQLWRSGQQEMARAAFELYWENSSGTGSVGLSWWLCDQEIMNSCMRANSPSCKVFSERYPELNSRSHEVYAGLTLYKKQECEGDVHYNEESMSMELLTYVDQFQEASPKKDQIADLLRIVRHPEYSVKIRQDAALRALQISTNAKDIKELVEYWLSLKSLKWAWYSVGESVHDKLMDIKSYKNAISVAEKLNDWRPTKSNRDRLILSHYQYGNKKRAWSLMKASRSKRELASEDSIEKVERELQKRFERK